MGLQTEIWIEFDRLLRHHEARLEDIKQEERTSEGYIIGEESNRNKTIKEILAKMRAVAEGAELTHLEEIAIVEACPFSNKLWYKHDHVIAEAQLQATLKAMED